MTRLTVVISIACAGVTSVTTITRARARENRGRVMRDTRTKENTGDKW